MTRASMEGGIRKLEEHKISTWRNILKKDKALKPMVVVDPSESLYRAGINCFFSISAQNEQLLIFSKFS